MVNHNNNHDHTIASVLKTLQWLTWQQSYTHEKWDLVRLMMLWALMLFQRIDRVSMIATMNVYADVQMLMMFAITRCPPLPEEIPTLQTSVFAATSKPTLLVRERRFTQKSGGRWWKEQRGYMGIRSLPPIYCGKQSPDKYSRVSLLWLINQ